MRLSHGDLLDVSSPREGHIGTHRRRGDDCGDHHLAQSHGPTDLVVSRNSSRWDPRTVRRAAIGWNSGLPNDPRIPEAPAIALPSDLRIPEAPAIALPSGTPTGWEKGGPDFSGDEINSDYIVMVTHGLHDSTDSMHLLVMDLHKLINKLQADLAQENLDGAKAYSINDNDRVLIKAFMSGLEALKKCYAGDEERLTWQLIPGSHRFKGQGLEEWFKRWL